MKKVLLLVAGLVIGYGAIAQKRATTVSDSWDDEQMGTKRKVAVYVTGSGDAGMNKVLGTKLVSEITRSGNYQAIERTSDFLKELQKEQKYQLSGNVDDDQISKLGKQFGVSLVCVADVTEVMGSKFLSSRLVNVETAAVVATSDYLDEMKTPQDLVKAAESVASQLLNISTQQKITTATENTDSESYATLHIYSKDIKSAKIMLDGKHITTLGSKDKITIKVNKEGNSILEAERISVIFVMIKDGKAVFEEITTKLLLNINIEFGKEYYIRIDSGASLMNEKKGKKEFDKN
ncbi:hypothetical protein AGMMS4956_16190 [Bacteroidia bacterium]|nr:hypothetical protein AGMMS4956_16190 [Bacteroidia bacterium]